MKKALNKLLEKILKEYPNAEGILFFSLEFPIEISIGKNVDKLLEYKDLPILSIDEGFNTEFNYTILNKSSIITLFMNHQCFISIYVLATEPNKELAREIFLKYNNQFNEIMKKYES